MFVIIFLIITAYLLGSIPSAVWIGKFFKKIDVREHGSGNAGTTNAVRVLGLRTGIIVLIVDSLKGFIAVFASRIIVPDITNEDLLMLYRFLLGAVAVTGHIFPVFARFQGGKGIATSLGVMLALMPLPVLLSVVVFTIVFLLSYTVSISSVIAAISFPPLCLVFARYADTYHLVFAILIAVIVLITHRNNIARIINRTEPRLPLDINIKSKKRNNS